MGLPQPLIIEVDSIIKSHKDKDQRLVEAECSNEIPDAEGDVILQKALLDASAKFVENGHVDIDHYSEIGHKIGIPDPTSWIIGRPIEVKDIGDHRTSVICEIMKSADGSVDPKKHKYDEFWESLQTDPPVKWRTSIYGFPVKGMVVDCTHKENEKGATRFLVKGIDWRSLAFTRKPINDSIKGYAKVVTSKSFTDAIIKGADIMPGEPSLPANTPESLRYGDPVSLHELYGEYQLHITRNCPFYDESLGNSLPMFREHFIRCRGLPYWLADIYAHALMYLLIREKKRKK